jgi:hypothetical protein
VIIGGINPENIGWVIVISLIEICGKANTEPRKGASTRIFDYQNGSQL